MIEFRENTPKRSINTKVVSKHGKYRDNLRKDFLNRCGYCNDIDTWRFNWFEIDHFVPQKYLKTITNTDYSNLVYSCRSCNNAKRAKWPSEDENIHNDGKTGFVDPCDDNYNKQFNRLDTGRIIPKTDLGEWMYNEMKLYKPQHEIIWNIHLLDKLIDEIENIHDPYNNEIKDKLLIIYRNFRNYIKELSSAGF